MSDTSPAPTRLAMTAVAALLAGLVLAAPAFSAQPLRAGRPAGAMRHRGHGGSIEGNLLPAEPMLQYFGGPVLRSNETYAIFWDPSHQLTLSYRHLISRYLRDVAADSDTTTNVFSVLDQYYDTSGPIRYESTFAGSSLDRDPYPSGCEPSSEYPTCFTNQQLAAELDAFSFRHKIARPSNRMFLVFTPPGVNSCFSTSEEFCFSNYFCAFHSSATSGHGTLLYANIPYAATPKCDDGDHPNGSPADVAIFDVAHEQMEITTDPLIEEATSFGPPIGWLDPEYGESSDKCEGFHGPTRFNGTGHYNQVVNGHEYILPPEWSNSLAQAEGYGCVLNGADRAPVAQFSSNVRHTTVKFDGSLTTDPDRGDSMSAYHWHFGDGTIEYAGARTTHEYAAPGTYRVELFVADQSGAEAEVEHEVTVGP